MSASRCPGCSSGRKGAGKYLCLGCWNSLPMATRRLLNRRDREAVNRLQELYRQIAAGVPLSKITVDV